ncbi:MAG: extracellular solute-binding protein, partial [Hyphomicrobiaceae bacterium]
MRVKASNWLGAGVVAAAFTLSGLSSGYAADKELTIFEWSGYEDPEFHKSYSAKHKAEPGYSFFSDEEEAFNKLKAGFKADMAHPCSQSVPKWRDAGMLKPIDTSRIPAYADLIPQLRDMPGFRDGGKTWIVPIDWGNTGLVYRTDKGLEGDIGSLKVLADPKYKGKVSMPDNVDDAYALAAMVQGIKDWTKMTDEQFKEASTFLRQVHKNTRYYWTDNANLSQGMASGEILLAWAWNETPTTMQAEGKPVAMKRDTKEGLSTWVCGFTLLNGAPGNEDKAYDYINSFLEDSSALYMVDAWGYGHANAKA